MTTATITPTRSIRIEGTATALSSICHSEGRAGTVTLFRREKVAQPDGSTASVPIVSGNAFRGLLRDHCAAVTWQQLGRPELPPAVFDLLWSGGTLAKVSSSSVLSMRQLGEVRRLIPMVSVFGGSGAGRIIEGKLTVLKMTPICAETAHILPEGMAGDPLPFRQLLQVEEFSRRDDGKRDELHAAIEGTAPRALGAGEVDSETGELLPPSDGALDRVMQMRYGNETLAAGTRLHWGMALRNVTDAETALIAAGLRSWADDGAHIGGRSATGHGRLKLDSSAWSLQTSAPTVGDALATTGDPLTEHMATHRDAILEALGWFV